MINEQDKSALEGFFTSQIAAKSTEASFRESRRTRLSTDKPSFFVKRHTPVMSRDEFELAVGSRPALASSLAARWDGSSLAPIAEELIDLGKRFEQLEEKSDLSSHVYEMF